MEIMNTPKNQINYLNNPARHTDLCHQCVYIHINSKPLNAVHALLTRAAAPLRYVLYYATVGV